jgi:uncharacterized membrane protein YkvA (DUF1232 family)
VENIGEDVTIELNPRDRRAWDRFRARVTEERDPAEASGLHDLLLLLPDLSVLLARLMRDERVPRFAKILAFSGLAYVFSPLDFLPSLLLGPLGLLDDLIIVAAALSAILNRVHPDIVRGHWSGQGDALVAIQRVTSWVEERMSGAIRAGFSRLGRS